MASPTELLTGLFEGIPQLVEQGSKLRERKLLGARVGTKPAGREGSFDLSIVRDLAQVVS